MTKQSMTKHLSIAALAAAGALVLGGTVRPAQATTVATIVGAYEKDLYDTPELDLTNSSGGQLINAQMVLKGYQPGTNNFGIAQTVPLSAALPSIIKALTRSSRRPTSPPSAAAARYASLAAALRPRLA